MLKQFYFCGRVRRPVSGAAAIALASLIALPAFAGNVEVSGVESSDLHDQFIIKYRDGSPERTSPALMQKSLDTAAARSRSDKAPRIRHLRRLAVGPEVIRTDRKLDRVETEVLIRQLATDPNVEYVEVDRWMHATLAPNDPYYSAQWGFHDADAGIRANEAWDKGAGAGVVVAVLDTGITPHSDLDSNVIAGYDFVSHAVSARDGDGRDADPTDEGDWNAAGECISWPEARRSSWHGTHVAGTIAALGNNNVGGTGTAFDAKILPVRVLAKCGGLMSDISDAITWASGGAVSGVPENVNPAEVINLSLGGAGSCSVTMQSAINGAVSRGTTLVVSAGNSNADVVGQSPANCDNVIVVASTTNAGERSSFSNYGALIDVAAPGSSILSTYNLGTTTPAGEGYAYFNGTSMAAPHVSGVIALLQSAAKDPKSPAQVEEIIRAKVRSFPVTPDRAIGGGILDAKLVSDVAWENVRPVADFSYSPSPNVDDLTVTFTDASSDSDGTIVRHAWDFGDGHTSNEANPKHTYKAIGEYRVSLWVTDDRGFSSHGLRFVKIPENLITNGTKHSWISGISGNVDSEQVWVVDVPEGASNLIVRIGMNLANAGLYVRHEAPPTSTTYDCEGVSRYALNHHSTCTFVAPRPGLYYVMLRGTKEFSGLLLQARYNFGNHRQTYDPGVFETAIHDGQSVEEPIIVVGRTGNAPSDARVMAGISHGSLGQLSIDLLAPDGSVYPLVGRESVPGRGIMGHEHTVDLSAEELNGIWRLRVRADQTGNIGRFTGFRITF